MITIELFSSPTCPHCPHAVKAVEDFVESNSDVKLIKRNTMIDGARAAQMGVRSVPSLFISGPNYEGNIGYVGVPSQKGLTKMVAIVKGEEEWQEEKGFFERIKEKIGI